jgi:tetratricopeptide (TPR) repeat protein
MLSKRGGSVRRFTYFIAIVLVFSSYYCGADLVEEGKKAFSTGDYTQAINLLTKAKTENPIDNSFNDMICLAFLYRGEELYQNTRNLKAFNGNFDKAEKYLPINPTNEFNKKYATMLLSLAKAYHSAKPKNDDEKELYHENALDRVKKAMALDSTNSSADSMLAQLKVDSFQNLVDMGEGLYKKAGRTGNADLYFTAEYYLKEALVFEPDNKKINNLLNKIVQKTLPVLNYREGVSLAVGGFSRERKAIIMTLSIKNYTVKSISLNLAKFKLVDTEGNKYEVNEDEMKKKELFGETCIKNTVLNQNNPSAEGIIAFTAPKDVKFAYVNYQMSKNKFARKYFP